MGEASTGRSAGTKTFFVLMTILVIAFLAGLLLMNNNYNALQGELAASKAQASSLQSSLNVLNQDYAQLQGVRNSLIAQVDELMGLVNSTQAVSRTFSYTITFDYDGRTLYYSDGMGGERAVSSPVVSFKTVEITPQSGESIVAEPWGTPLSKPLWLKEPETDVPVGIILHSNAIREYFTSASFSWGYLYSWDYVEAGYREHHDYYDLTLTGTVQLLYFSQNKTFIISLIENNDSVMDQSTLTLP